MPKAKKNKAKTLAKADKAQYETERLFAAENVVRNMLESGVDSTGATATFTFETPEGEESLGSCELNGVDDARDKQGIGGAWVSVRFYVPNLDIDSEIES